MSLENDDDVEKEAGKLMRASNVAMGTGSDICVKRVGGAHKSHIPR